MTIRDAINEIIKKRIPIVSKPCRVLSVNEAESTCDVEPLDKTAKIFDVLLNADLTDETGIVAVPAVDSVVYVTFVSPVLAFVSLSAVIDKVFIKIKDISLEVDKDLIKLNGDSDGGLTITPTLRTELNKTTARITALEVLIAALGASQASVAGSIPLFAPLIPAWSAVSAGVAALPPQGLYNTNIESTKVKQG